MVLEVRKDFTGFRWAGFPFFHEWLTGITKKHLVQAATSITGDWSFLFFADEAKSGMLKTEMLKSVQG